MVFVKGQSGNPAGKPKQGDNVLKALCKQHAPECLNRILEIARDKSNEDSYKANQWICEKGYGKPSQEVELEHSGQVTTIPAIYEYDPKLGNPTT